MAYEMGLTTAQFWRMTPVEFDRMQQAYERRLRREQEPGAIYFRELYALLFNVNRTKATDPLLKGIDVLRLKGERKPRKPKAAVYSEDEIAAAEERMNRLLASKLGLHLPTHQPEKPWPTEPEP